MDEKKLRKWLELKLEKGVSEKALKNTLRKKGYDPKLVEEVKNSDNPVEENSKSGKKTESSGKKSDGRKLNPDAIDLSKHSDQKEERQSENEESGGQNKEKQVEEKKQKFKQSNSKHTARKEESKDIGYSSAQKDENTSKSSSGSSRSFSLPSSSIPFGKPDFSRLFDPVRKLPEKLSSVLRNFAGYFKILAAASVLIGVLTGAYLSVPFDSVAGFSSNAVGEIKQLGSQQQSSESKQANRDLRKVYITEDAAVPSRPTVSAGEKLLFVNNASYGFRIEFESGKKGFKLKPDGSKTVSFESLTYYNAKPLNSKGSPVQGSVYVS